MLWSPRGVAEACSWTTRMRVRLTAQTVPTRAATPPMLRWPLVGQPLGWPVGRWERWLECLGWCASAKIVSVLDWDSLSGGGPGASGPGAGASLDLLGRLQRVHQMVGAALALGLAAVQRSGASEAATGLSAGAWLAHTARISGTETAGLLRVGELLERFEELRVAVLAGEIPLEHPRFLATVCDPHTADCLVAFDHELTQAALRIVACRSVRPSQAPAPNRRSAAPPL